MRPNSMVGRLFWTLGRRRESDGFSCVEGKPLCLVGIELGDCDRLCRVICIPLSTRGSGPVWAATVTKRPIVSELRPRLVVAILKAERLVSFCPRLCYRFGRDDRRRS